MKVWLISILLITSSTNATSMQSNPHCKVRIDSDDSTVRSCVARPTFTERQRCFQKAIGHSINIHPAHKDDGVFLTMNELFCLNSIFIDATHRPARFYVSATGHIDSISELSHDITIGRITFPKGGRACGLLSEGKTSEVLTPEYRQIPDVTKVKISFPRCSNNRIGGEAVEILESATVCGMKLSKNTKFYYDVDGHYHFTALDSGEMLAPDKNDPNIADVYKIKKGLNYRNRNPADTPCAWKLSPPPTETEVD